MLPLIDLSFDKTAPCGIIRRQYVARAAFAVRCLLHRINSEVEIVKRTKYFLIAALFASSLVFTGCDEDGDGVHDTNADIEAACSPGGSSYPCLGGGKESAPPPEGENSCWDCPH